MKPTIRNVLVATTAAILLDFSGCGENNEARIEGAGVTPPNAAATSEEGAKVPRPNPTKSPYAFGPKKPPTAKTPELPK